MSCHLRNRGGDGVDGEEDKTYIRTTEELEPIGVCDYSALQGEEGRV